MVGESSSSTAAHTLTSSVLIEYIRFKAMAERNRRKVVESFIVKPKPHIIQKTPFVYPSS
ncbi:hypothetical protein L211DRAFT_285799 [Terfezia boudieri ATCC MYA-4762]|uniref:Uncharacterized protein n=1 Tax=Terfezia boudieri ATCC MYA-4762 TaxID=1051890 RepID=A0A3N4LPX8_9PEZI|nr:hypothetical protein L211DRAFT_285799 [Terfezia boudieri ATCC MYA-4762]